MKRCVVCAGKILKSKLVSHPNAKTCCSECSRKSRLAARTRSVNISSGSVGAIGELQVCADLLDRGYGVFRSVSPSCPFDLVIYKYDRLAKVEVKFGTKLVGGRICCSVRQDQKYDILAVYYGSGRVSYCPSLKEFFKKRVKKSKIT